MNKKLRKTRGRVFGSRLTATVSISLVLLLFAIMTTLGFFARELSQTAKENICVTVLLDDDITPAELTALQKIISQAEWTKSYQYIDKETALKELTEELGESPESFLGFNPLPATIEIQMKSEYTQLEQIRKIVNTLSAPSYVQEVVYREDLIQLVNKNLLSIGKLLLAIAVVLTLISFMLIRNTVRLMIYAKRFLIHTMCLVGARRNFIRRPFVRQNVVCGIVSAILALGLYYLTLSAMDKVFPGISRMVTSQMYGAMLALLLGLGILISAVATVFSVNRFLKMSNDELYYV